MTPKRAAALAEYHRNLLETGGAHPPWGSLTGIRPTKLVREWISLGMTDEEILAVLQDPYCVSSAKAKLALRVAHAEAAIAKKLAGTMALYVNIPFCPTRCAYCSFTSAGSEKIPADYINVLCGEIRLSSPSSIYIGGGTPTILSEDSLARVLSSLPPCREITVEAGRPDTITPGKLEIMRHYGVNRLCINPQTLNDNTLAKIGRAHTSADFVHAFKMARAAGFERISCDIIAGLSGEGQGDMRHNFEVLSELKPENITVHMLVVKKNSIFAGSARARESAEEAEIVAEQLEIAAEYCEKLSLYPYYLYRGKSVHGAPSPGENVGYAAPGTECLYNVAMMAEITPVTGVGAGACTKIFTGDKISRVFNPKNPEIYIQRLSRREKGI